MSKSFSKTSRIAALSLFLLTFFQSSILAQDGSELIIKFKRGAPARLGIELQSIDARINRSLLQDQDLFDDVEALGKTFPLRSGAVAEFTGIYTLHLARGVDPEDEIEMWRSNPDVEYVQINRRAHVDHGLYESVDRDSEKALFDDNINDVHKDSLYHLDVIRAFDAWDVTKGDPNVLIGIVDTGIMLDHPDLRNQIWINPGEDINGNGVFDSSDLDGIDNDSNGYVDDIRGYDFVDWRVSLIDGDYVERDNDPYPDNHVGRPGQTTHGTEMAGTIAAESNNLIGIAGVAPNCKIVALRAFGGNGAGEDDDTAAAIIYGADLGVDVLNLSFGDSYYSPIVRDAIRYAESKGVVVVASAGNDGSQEAHYPSDYPEVIGAAWLNEAGERLGSLAARGVGIDVGAPGSRVYTTTLPRPFEDGTVSLADTMIYRKVSGSSISAPQVAAAAALLKSLDPNLSPEAIKGILKSTAIDISQFGNTRFAGSGRIDIAAALGVPYPTNVSISSPDRDSSLDDGQVDVIGSVIAPLFLNYTLDYGRLTSSIDSIRTWIPIVSESTSQVREGVLGSLDTSSLEEGGYVVRLSTKLSTGQVLEDWRRVYLYRNAPQVEIFQFDHALVNGGWGVLAEISSEDLVESELEIQLNGASYFVKSDRRSRRQKVVWNNEESDYGEAQVFLHVTNVSGFTESIGPLDIAIPRNDSNIGAFVERRLSVPAGRLVPSSMDLDRDGLKEIFFNRYENLSVSDSLFHYEWNGDDFIKSSGTGFAINGRPVIPQAVGDSDGDGNDEILLQALPTQQIPLWLLWEYRRGFDRFFLSFPDTTADRDLIIDPDSVVLAFAADFMDLDQDGRTEILTHDTDEWTIVEYFDRSYSRVARLLNRTSIEESDRSDQLGRGSANALGQAKALHDDLDGDGNMDLLSMDSDADFIIYESTGDNSYRETWRFETRRYGISGSRFASGDFDGDGLNEFITYTSNFSARRSDREYDAAFGLYYHFETDGNDSYRLVDSLAVDGNVFTSGSLNSGDLDNDGIKEVVLVHPPDMFVLKANEEGLYPVFHRGNLMRGDADGIISVSTVIEDFDGDGNREVITNSSDQFMHSFEYDFANAPVAVPRWKSARRTQENTSLLRWQTDNTYDVQVMRGMQGGELDLLAIVSGSQEYVDADVDRDYDYALIAVNRDGKLSPLSPRRFISLGNIPALSSVGYPNNDVELIFDGALADIAARSSFVVEESLMPSRVVVAGGGKKARLYFEPRLTGNISLRVSGLKDVSGSVLADTVVQLSIPSLTHNDLYLLSWESLSGNKTRLIFNKALDPSFASNTQNYRLEPGGRIGEADYDSLKPSEVVLTLVDRFVGAIGLQTNLIVVNMRGADGSGLAAEGSVAALASFTDNLDDVFVFPNPYKAREVNQDLIIAGLPITAEVYIYTMDGLPVRSLEEIDGNGGLEWDLKDKNGIEVPSGIYLMRVESDGLDSVLVKAAVIR